MEDKVQKEFAMKMLEIQSEILKAIRENRSVKNLEDKYNIKFVKPLEKNKDDY